MTRTTLLLGALAALAAPPAAAQNETDADVGEVVLTTAVPFLQIEPDSRASGMGMAGVAVADNAYAPFWNPAGLAGQQGTEVSFTHAPWLPALGANLSYEHLSAKHGLGDAGTLGGHLTYFDLGEQTATSTDGTPLGTFSSYELALGVSYGYPVTENFSVGAGSRFIFSSLTGGRTVGSAKTSAASTFGVDLGMKYTGPDLGLGQSSRPTIAVNLANMGPGVSYVLEDTLATTAEERFPDAIPTTLRFGAALDTRLDDFNRIQLAIDFNKVVVNRDPTTGEYDPFYEALFTSWQSRDIKTVRSRENFGKTCDELRADGDTDSCSIVSGLKSLTMGVGGEYWYNDLFAMRAGYFYEDPANGNRQFLTFGTGFRYSLVGVDISYIYALQENSPLADQLRFSLLLNIPR